MGQQHRPNNLHLNIRCLLILVLGTVPISNPIDRASLLLQLPWPAYNRKRQHKMAYHECCQSVCILVAGCVIGRCINQRWIISSRAVCKGQCSCWGISSIFTKSKSSDALSYGRNVLCASEWSEDGESDPFGSKLTFDSHIVESKEDEAPEILSDEIYRLQELYHSESIGDSKVRNWA